MSKVIHISDKAHEKAKVFCKEHGLRMSDWVASLINEAAVNIRSDTSVRTAVPKKKMLPELEDTPQTNKEGLPSYALPPFWKGKEM